MATKQYKSNVPLSGEGIQCKKITSKKFQNEADAFGRECNSYVKNFENADDYISMMEGNIDVESADPLMQKITDTVKTLKESNNIIKYNILSFPPKINNKAQELDEAETYYLITEKTEN